MPGLGRLGCSTLCAMDLSVSRARELLGTRDPGLLRDVIARLEHDERPGVHAAVAAARRRLEHHIAEQDRVDALCELERSLRKDGCRVVAGVDEVGRGALAGPVSAGACVLPPDARIEGLRDSKQLSPQARILVAERVRAVAIASHIAHVPAQTIDSIGIAGATLLAMRLALEGLSTAVDHVLVDGRDVALEWPHTAVVKGDATVAAIAAAAVLAKVARDDLMASLDAEYPGYGFAENKGYGSAGHLAAIERAGPSDVHRLSFGPCAQRRLF